MSSDLLSELQRAHESFLRAAEPILRIGTEEQARPTL